jgi:hypothetical protein
LRATTEGCYNFGKYRLVNDAHRVFILRANFPRLCTGILLPQSANHTDEWPRGTDRADVEVIDILAENLAHHRFLFVLVVTMNPITRTTKVKNNVVSYPIRGLLWGMAWILEWGLVFLKLKQCHVDSIASLNVGDCGAFIQKVV